MPKLTPLPDALGDVFTVGEARGSGIGAGRLRGADLGVPFRGVRTRLQVEKSLADPYEHATHDTMRRVVSYATRLRSGEFFAYETAVRVYGGPLPTHIGREIRPLDIGVFDGAPLPRAAGVRGRRLTPAMTNVVVHDGFATASPASTWAMLGRWNLIDLVALGDYLCRVWREGVGRPNAGADPLATTQQLSAALGAGRRRIGGPTLRDALALIREDSWSPRESACRVHLVRGGLPEPELNLDLFDAHGGFLGCVDLAYPEWKVAVEYQGSLHGLTYAEDIERIEHLRAEGWIIIQVSSALHAKPRQLVSRVARALRSRGWRG